MQLASVSGSRVRTDDQTPFETLIASLSSILVNVRPDDLESTIAQILGHLCPALGIDHGALIEFSSTGGIQSHHAWTRTGQSVPGDGDPASWSWLLERVRADGQV